MSNVYSNPLGLNVPANYHHSVETPANCQFLYVAGQTGVDPAGNVPDGIEAQAKIVFERIKIVLEASNYGLEHVVFMKSFLVNREDRAGYQKIRETFWGDIKPASTFLIVSGLADPDYLLEVECIAAKPA
jgi:2-iminobutanoate/2-iminopropanoate deaminase